MSPARVPYAGIASRALGLAVDAALVNLIAITTGAVFALAASLVGEVRFDTLGKVIAAGAWIALLCGYFVVFWSTAGQTPGQRLMNVRVTTAAGNPLGVWRAIVRVIGLGLSILPLFAGFLPVLVDDRRRGLLDYMAGTVVRYADAPLLAEEPATFAPPEAPALAAPAPSGGVIPNG